MAPATQTDRPLPMRDRILDRALQLFNERGIEYVAVRELARDLGIQGGNITYHFPTRDDLILAFADQLREADAAAVRIPRNPTLYDFLEMHRAAFRNHHRFRCLFLSLPRLLDNERLAEGLRAAMEAGGAGVVSEYLTRLRDGGAMVRTLGGREIERISAFIALVNHGWIADAAISFPKLDPEEQMAHYLQIIADHLRGFATIGGRVDLQRFLREVG